jgi:hypothetical protein
MLIIIAIYNLIQNLDDNNIKSDNFCNLNNFDIDKIHIIKRDPEYQKLINKLIDEKRYIFTDKELKILKNKFQIYNVSENDIQNITKILLGNCNKQINTLSNNITLTPEEFMDVQSNINNNDEYNKILNDFNTKEKEFCDLNCKNTEFLKSNQKNYYMDLFGNNILSDTLQYMANYYSTINDDDDNKCVPVQTVKVKQYEGWNKNELPETDKPYFTNPFNIQPLDENYTNYIIPIQYHNDIQQTNIYNIDNQRIINPYTVY